MHGTGSSRRPSFPRRLLALALFPGVLSAATGAWDERPQVAARLVTPYAAAARSGRFEFGVEFRLAKGWHSYWRNSGDAGFAPVFDFSATPELVEPIVHWPAPHRLAAPGGLVAFGYERSVVHPVQARLVASPRGDRLSLVADLDILVCEIECVPFRLRPRLEQPLSTGAGAAAPDEPMRLLLDAWRARVPIPIASLAGARAATIYHPGANGAPATLEIRWSPPSAFGNAPSDLPSDLFFDTHELLRFGPPVPQPALPSGEIAFTATVEALDQSKPLPATTEVVWVLTRGEDGPSWEERTQLRLRADPSRSVR